MYTRRRRFERWAKRRLPAVASRLGGAWLAFEEGVEDVLDLVKLLWRNLGAALSLALGAGAFLGAVGYWPMRWLSVFDEERAFGLPLWLVCWIAGSCIVLFVGTLFRNVWRLRRKSLYFYRPPGDDDRIEWFVSEAAAPSKDSSSFGCTNAHWFWGSTQFRSWHTRVDYKRNVLVLTDRTGAAREFPAFYGNGGRLYHENGDGNAQALYLCVVRKMTSEEVDAELAE